MLKDRKLIWVLEYVIGLGLVAVTLFYVARSHPKWNEAYSWAYLLFIACSGIVLLGCASAMRQRMNLSERIANLERMLESQRGQNQTHGQSEKKRTPGEQFVGSVN